MLFCVYGSSSSPNRRPRELLSLLQVIQLLYFQQLPHSFAQWTCRNPFLFNRFRTLSIAMGVYTPRAPSSSRAHPLLLLPETTQTLEDRPSRRPWFSFFGFHESPVTNHESWSLCAPQVQNQRTNCAISCPEPERGVRTNSFGFCSYAKGVCNPFRIRSYENTGGRGV